MGIEMQLPLGWSTLGAIHTRPYPQHRAAAASGVELVIESIYNQSCISMSMGAGPHTPAAVQPPGGS